jgi:hypothetical protein
MGPTQTTVSIPGSAPSVGPTPYLRPRANDLWNRCVLSCQQLQRALRHQLDEVTDGADVFASPPGVFPAWVRCDFWMPAGERRQTRRCYAEVTLHPQPHKKFPFVLIAICGRGTERPLRASHVLDATQLPDWDKTVAGLIEYFFDKRPSAPEVFEQSRTAAFFIGLFQRNGFEPLRKHSGVGTFVAFALFMIPEVGPILGGIAMLFIFLSSLERGRVHQVMDSGRPANTPRTLDFIDSWHAVIPSAAAHAPRVTRELESAGERERWAEESVQHEQIWHHSLEGLEVRQQTVFAFRKALVFCHVQRYGDDLYVGWDAHLNRAFWREDALAAGEDQTGRLTHLTGAVADVASPSEYDLADVNMLSERTHRRLQAIVKRLISDLRIDAEIDFAPIRRDRSGVLATVGRQEQAPGGVVSRLVRRTS